MSREDIAKEIYYDNFCLERGHGVSYKWEVTDDDIKEKCFLLADYILDNYISKADHEAEIKKARVEVANKALYESDIDCTECVHVGERDLCTKSPECPCVEGYLKFIISDNTEGE